MFLILSLVVCGQLGLEIVSQMIIIDSNLISKKSVGLELFTTLVLVNNWEISDILIEFL